MKKYICFLICLLLCLSVCACSSSPPPGEAENLSAVADRNPVTEKTELTGTEAAKASDKDSDTESLKPSTDEESDVDSESSEPSPTETSEETKKPSQTTSEPKKEPSPSETSKSPSTSKPSKTPDPKPETNPPKDTTPPVTEKPEPPKETTPPKDTAPPKETTQPKEPEPSNPVTPKSTYDAPFDPVQIRNDCIAIAKGYGLALDESLNLDNSCWATPVFACKDVQGDYLKKLLKEAIQFYADDNYRVTNGWEPNYLYAFNIYYQAVDGGYLFYFLNL